MVAPAVSGIDLFNLAGRSISGWMKSFKAGTASHVRPPFCYFLLLRREMRRPPCRDPHVCLSLSRGLPDFDSLFLRPDGQSGGVS
jgi:hypothetical protein